VARATEGYDLPEGVPLFLFVGRLMDYKGLPIIADALATLHSRGIDFRCVFIGGGADGDKLKDRIAEEGLSEKVFFTGPVHDREVLRAWNTRADLFLFPSTYDTNGIVVREAAACATASVLIKGSCAAEGIADRRNGFLIEENADSMAALLQELSSDMDLMKKTGINAMNEIYISWNDAVHSAVKMYEDLLAVCDDKDTMRKRHNILKSKHLMGIEDGIMDWYCKFANYSDEVYMGMQSNFTALFDEAGTKLKNVIADLSNMKDNIKNAIQDKN
jgi:glycogen synthase